MSTIPCYYVHYRDIIAALVWLLWFADQMKVCWCTIKDNVQHSQPLHLEGVSLWIPEEFISQLDLPSSHACKHGYGRGQCHPHLSHPQIPPTDLHSQQPSSLTLKRPLLAQMYMPKQNSAQKITFCTLTHTLFKSGDDGDVTSDLYSIGTSVDQEIKFDS